MRDDNEFMKGVFDQKEQKRAETGDVTHLIRKGHPMFRDIAKTPEKDQKTQKKSKRPVGRPPKKKEPGVERKMAAKTSDKGRNLFKASQYKRYNVSLAPEHMEMLRKLSVIRVSSRSQLIRDAILRYLKEEFSSELSSQKEMYKDNDRIMNIQEGYGS